MKKRWMILLMLLALVFCFGAGAEEPHGDGNGIVSRPLLASMYKWLGDASSFWKQMSFDDVSNAVGKWGLLKEKTEEDRHAAVWTDGNVSVAVTFRNFDGFWGVTSISTGMSSDEYENADISFLPRIGNREAGSSPTAENTQSVDIKGGRGKVTVTAEVPTEYWFPSVSFGEFRFAIAPNESAKSGAPYMALSFWPDEASLREDLAKNEDLTETETLYQLGMVMPGFRGTRFGMQMVYYMAELREDLWMLISLYRTEVYFGSEAEAVLKSLTVQEGDWSYHYEPLDLGIDDGPSWNGGIFDMGVIENSPAVAEGTLEISTSESTGSIFVTNNLPVESLAFSHDNESDEYYSYTDFDILVMDPDTDEVCPVLRMWIYLNTKEGFMDISSVTFTVMGKEYTFSELSEEDDFEEREKDFCQTMLIRFDQNSWSFLSDLAMERAFAQLEGAEPMRVVFHGKQDLETEMGSNLLEPFALYWEMYEESNGMLCLDGYSGNPMEVKLAQ